MNGLRDLEELIDALDRPWAPQENDRLRAHLHAARRDPTGRATTELKEAIERSMRELSSDDLRWVLDRSRRKRSTTADLAVSLMAEVATEMLAQLLRAPRRHHRRHRRG